ncbi:MAG: hypothetical protein JXR07_17935 [Reichenbachiella sp.]
MIISFESTKRALTVFSSIIISFAIWHIFLINVDWDFSEIFHRHIDSKSFFIEFAPEIWLTLLSLVLGTLIIVISIASQSNPKLIDYYIGDYPSLIFTCFITLAGIENIYLQLNLSVDSIFYENIIFVNAYLLMPLAVLSIIPYAFYILSYTKTSSLIQTITKANRRMIEKSFKKQSKKGAEKIQLVLLATINQLDDQHGYVSFKEPKSDIIHSLGELTRYFLENKHRADPKIFSITQSIKKDISFKTLIDEFATIEKSQTFFEHKVFKIYTGIYLQLINQGYHDLAALCSHELSRIGVISFQTNNLKILDLSFIQFNTYLRFGIKYASQNTDIRHVFNAVFHYTQLILFLVSKGKNESVIKGCEYLTYYGKEIYKLSFTDPHFIFLIDSFTSEIQRVLIAMNDAGFEENTQMQVLKIYATIEPTIKNKKHLDRVRNNNSRSIKIGLILFYLNKQEVDFVDELIEDILDDLAYFDTEEVLKIVKNDCLYIKSNQPKFWEFSDRGDKNIYYSPHKNHLQEFYKLFTNKLRKTIVRRRKIV